MFFLTKRRNKLYWKLWHTHLYETGTIDKYKANINILKPITFQQNVIGIVLNADLSNLYIGNLKIYKDKVFKVACTNS